MSNTAGTWTVRAWWTIGPGPSRAGRPRGKGTAGEVRAGGGVGAEREQERWGEQKSGEIDGGGRRASSARYRPPPCDFRLLPLEDLFEEGSEQEYEGKGADLRPALESDGFQQGTCDAEAKGRENTTRDDQTSLIAATPGEDAGDSDGDVEGDDDGGQQFDDCSAKGNVGGFSEWHRQHPERLRRAQELSAPRPSVAVWTPARSLARGSS